MSDARALTAAAKAARDAGRLEEAIALQRRALGLLGEGDPGAHAHALRHLADMLSDAGDAAGAAPLYAEVLAHHGTADRSLDAANAVRGAALNAGRLGDMAEARRLWCEARDRYAQLGDALAPGVAEAEARLAAISQG